MSSTDGIKSEDNSTSTSKEVAVCGSSSSPETCSTSSVMETVVHKDDKNGAPETNSGKVDRDSVTTCGSQRSMREIISAPKFVPLGTPSRPKEER